MKTEFKLIDEQESTCGEVVVELGNKHLDPHLRITLNPSQGLGDKHYFIYNSDLERFAVNILKALKSNKLK